MKNQSLLIRRYACKALKPVITPCLLDDDSLLDRAREIVNTLRSLGLDAAVKAVMAKGTLAQDAPHAFADSTFLERCAGRHRLPHF